MVFRLDIRGLHFALLVKGDSFKHFDLLIGTSEFVGNDQREFGFCQSEVFGTDSMLVKLDLA